MDLLNYQVPLWGVLVYWFVMAAISKMPIPRENERWYGWLFGTLQMFSANVERARVGMAKSNGNGGTIYGQAPAPKLEPPKENKGG